MAKEKGPSRPRTLSKAEKVALDTKKIPYPKDVRRPTTRGECKHARPCPFISCRYHLYLHVDQASGRVKIHHPDKDWDQLEETCALDVADDRACTLEEVAGFYNVSRERIRQIEYVALGKLYDAMAHVNDEQKPFWQDVQKERRKEAALKACETCPEPPKERTILDVLIDQIADMQQWKRDVLLRDERFQRRVVRMAASGTPITELSTRLKIAPKKIIFWVVLYRTT